MGDILKGFFGSKPQEPVDDGFADFVGAPDPSPASISPVTPLGSANAVPTGSPGRPYVYTKWYRVWERTTPSDFITEAFVLPFMIIIFVLHAWGRRKNKDKATAWIKVHAPLLQKEYAQVGFEAQPMPSAEEVEALGLAKASAGNQLVTVDDLLKEKSGQDYLTYATGRQNIAFTDIRITLYKLYNPAVLFFEWFFSFLFVSIKKPVETVRIISYSFDGQEGDVVPIRSQEQQESVEAQAKSKSSVYDPFVWAVVHKELMKEIRDDRYDISLTSTKDHAKLPPWTAVMSESAEITEKLLTNELIKALQSAGDAFEYLIVSDQPPDKPNSLEDTKARKRLSLSLKLPSGTSSSAYEPTLPIFNFFLRFPDHIAASAHFRPEVTKKIRAVRDEEVKKILKVDEDEKAEERRVESEKKKKEIRDQKVRGMTADEQRKFLEKEKERNAKKQEKRISRKG